MMVCGGKIYCCGVQDYGLLGFGSSNKPVSVPTVFGYFVKMRIEIHGIALGDDYCVAWEKSGSLYTWGKVHSSD